jgi:hypothetical protein
MGLHEGFSGSVWSEASEKGEMRRHVIDPLLVSCFCLLNLNRSIFETLRNLIINKLHNTSIEETESVTEQR